MLFFVLFYLFDKRKWKGKHILFTYLLSYGIARFIIEFFRGDTYRGFFLGLSTSQIISLLTVIVVLILIIFERRKKKATEINSQVN